MTFAWQGFSFEHPDDWSPIALSGGRQQGYARLEGPSGSYIQIRWHSGGQVSEGAVKTYLRRLSEDAAKEKVAFHADQTEREDEIRYMYRGSKFGTGSLFKIDGDSRAYFLEAVARSKSQSSDQFRKCHDTFLSGPNKFERWSLFGLDFRIPRGAKLERHELKAGSTKLLFAGRGVTLTAERWAFGKQLLSRHPLADWATTVSGIKSPTIDQQADRVQLTGRTLIGTPIHVLAAYIPSSNIITMIRSNSRHKEWTPQWDWLI